jgi:hypothetical protein
MAALLENIECYCILSLENEAILALKYGQYSSISILYDKSIGRRLISMVILTPAALAAKQQTVRI